MSDEATNPSADPSEDNQPESVPRAVMLKRISEERKKVEAAKAEAAQYQEQISELETLKQQLAALEEEKELAGKTAAEKERARAEKERLKTEKQLEELRAAVNERDQLAAQRLATLQAERAGREVMDALSAKKAINAGKAARYAMTEIQVSHGDDGSMTATYGDEEDVSIRQAVDAWLKDNDNFLPMPAGGASTRNGGSAGGRKPQDMSTDELLAAAKRK